MIYTYKSQASSDVIMLEPHGNQMLTIFGREPSLQGINTLAQLPAVIAALQAAISEQEAVESKRRDHPGLVIEVEGDSGRQHDCAAPLINLLRSSAQASKAALWSV